MDTLIIQSGVRHGRIAELTRSSSDTLYVGRGYDNDLVMTDVHIAPRQIKLFYDGDTWKMSVLDHTNPVFLNDAIVTDESPAVQAGDTITLGRTRLTLHAPGQPVEKARKLVLANWLARGSVGFLAPVAVLVAAALIDLLLAYGLYSTDLKWGELMSGMLMGLAVALFWAGLWALGGRIIRHQHHFGLQLIATACVLLLATFIDLFAATLAYPFHQAVVTEAFVWITYFVWIAVLLNLNLLIATNLMRTQVVAVFLSALITGGLYSFYWLGDSDEEYLDSVPEHSSTLLPPLVHLDTGTSSDSYFEQIAKEIDRLDEE